ncbi:hypothetical protein CANFE02_18100 [Ligilactobacillus animalis]
MYFVKARNELPCAATITFLPSNKSGAMLSSQNGLQGRAINPIISMKTQLFDYFSFRHLFDI